MLDIDNKTQSEIEEMFSQELYKQEMDIVVAQYVNQIPEEMYIKLASITSKDMDETEMLMIDIITYIGNSRNGIAHSEDMPHIREFSIKEFCISIANMLGHEYDQHNYVVAKDIVVEFDEQLWNIEQTITKNEKAQFLTLTTVRVDILLSEDAEKLAGYRRFKLPLVEEPTKWTEGEQGGGYHLSEDKITLNKGEAKQPQSVLDVANKLQSQAYTLREYNLQEQYEYVLAKIKAKNWKKTEEGNIASAKNMFLTVKESYEAMKDRQFYLEVKYDFRGRAYTTGYDINLQGASQQKAMLKPVFIEGIHYNAEEQ